MAIHQDVGVHLDHAAPLDAPGSATQPRPQMDSRRLFEESKFMHSRPASGLSPAEAGVALVMVSPRRSS